MTKSLDTPAQFHASREFDAQLAAKLWEGSYSPPPAIAKRTLADGNDAPPAANHSSIEVQNASAGDKPHTTAGTDGSHRFEPTDPETHPQKAGTSKPSDSATDGGKPTDGTAAGLPPEALDLAAKAIADALKKHGEITDKFGEIIGRGLQGIYNFDGDKSIQELINKVNEDLAPQYKLKISEDPAVTKLADDIAKELGQQNPEYVRVITLVDAEGKEHGRILFVVPNRENQSN
jgi:hypothetical protein